MDCFGLLLSNILKSMRLSHLSLVQNGIYVSHCAHTKIRPMPGAGSGQKKRENLQFSVVNLKSALVQNGICTRIGKKKKNPFGLLLSVLKYYSNILEGSHSSSVSHYCVQDRGSAMCSIGLMWEIESKK